MIHSLLRGSAVATALAATIGLASTLTACASSNTSANAGSSVPNTATPTSTATTAASPAPSVSGSINPGGPVKPMPSVSTTQTQAATLPSGAKFTPIEHLSQSPDGRTLNLAIMAQGGACGIYTVVVQESAAVVHVGLAKMPVKTGVMCPMYVAEKAFPAKLSSPVGNRSVIDLATNAPISP
jgi:hypothetical protein